ncbi:MAG: T9SS type A sorting domain-containing protein [Bacteroidales bacterium]|nr:T9SS type A sorting domain-containing protein [Bacteroidales bacterium]
MKNSILNIGFVMMGRARRLWVLAFLLALAGTARGQAEWLPNSPDDVFMCISHPSPGVVYLGGVNALYKSIDNGNSWDDVYMFDSEAGKCFYNIFFYDEWTGFAIGGEIEPCSSIGISADHNVYRTTDGGTSWVLIDSLHTFSKMTFINHDTLIALDKNEKALFRTMDNGVSWTKITGEIQISDFCVLNDSVVYVLTLFSYLNDQINASHPVHKSMDLGSTWVPIELGDAFMGKEGPVNIVSIHFYNDGIGELMGGRIFYTEDDFATYNVYWTGFTTPEFSHIRSIFLNSGYTISTAWNAGNLEPTPHIVARLSKVFGFHAQFQELFMGFVTDMAACEEDTLFFLTGMVDSNSSYGVVYRFHPYDFPNTEVHIQEHIPLDIFPNPVENQCFITCDYPIKRVIIIDVSGKTVLDENNINLQYHRIDTYSWPKGVYIIKVYIGGSIVSAKIIKS